MNEAKQYLIAFGYTILIALGFALLFAVMPKPHWISIVVRWRN